MSKFRPRIPHEFRWVGCLALCGGCLAADPRQSYASLVESYWPTPFTDEAAPYSDPGRALGAPDGRTVALGEGAFVALRFFAGISEGLGPDLRVVEIGPDGARARVAVSADGVHFIELADPAMDNGATLYDLAEAGIPIVHSVRIRGLDDLGADPGFDLDAVEALNLP